MTGMQLANLREGRRLPFSQELLWTTHDQMPATNNNKHVNEKMIRISICMAKMVFKYVFQRLLTKYHDDTISFTQIEKKQIKIDPCKNRLHIYEYIC